MTLRQSPPPSEQEDGTGQQLITPPLDGTILPGVTRDSILQLARHWGDCEVLEAPIMVGTLKKVRCRRLGPSAGFCRSPPWAIMHSTEYEASSPSQLSVRARSLDLSCLKQHGIPQNAARTYLTNICMLSWSLLCTQVIAAAIPV